MIRRHDSLPLLLMLLSTESVQMQLDPKGRPNKSFDRKCYDITRIPRNFNSKFESSVQKTRKFHQLHSDCLSCVSVCLSPQKPSNGVALLCGNFSITAVLRVSQCLLCRRFVSSRAVLRHAKSDALQQRPYAARLLSKQITALVGSPGFFAMFTGVLRWSLS
jgi:hypothetical protein